MSRLAGAQDDAHGLVLDLVADVLDEFEAGDVGFHDDVEQHRGDVRVLAHQFAALGRGIGREDFQRRAVQAVIGQREAGALVHRMIVIDDRDFPFTRGGVLPRGVGIVDQVEDIVLFGH